MAPTCVLILRCWPMTLSTLATPDVYIHVDWSILSISLDSSGGSRGGSKGAQESPFGLRLALRSHDTDVRLNGTPLSGYRTKKLLLWLTLECSSRNLFENRSIGQVGLVVRLKNERNGCGFAQKWAWLLKIHAQPYIRTPF